MTALKTIIVTFSMFSAIPMPKIEWEEKSMRYAMCAFPLVGAAIGVACWGWSALCRLMMLPEILKGAGLCLLPVMLTGGIHLDGYADTCDALASHGPVEKKREILKDPHMGAFAAIRLCCYFIASLALYTALPFYNGAALTLGFCLSRALSGLAVLSFPLAKDTGLAYMFASAADKKRGRAALIALSAVLIAALCACKAQGAAMAFSAICVFAYYKRMVRVHFGGLSGDLAGWFLQTAEIWMLTSLCAVQYMEVLI